MDYTGLRDNTVRPLIAAFGKVVSLRRPGTTTGWTKSWNAAEGRYQWVYAGPPNPPADGTTVYIDPATVPVDVAGHAVRKAYRQEEIDGTNVMSGDSQYITADLPSPTTADKLVVGSLVLTIVNVTPIEPGDVTLVWKLQCR